MTEQKKKQGRPAGTKNKKSEPSAKAMKAAGSRVKDEIWAIIIIALGSFLAIALHTEAAGKFGLALSGILTGAFGWASIILPYYLMVYGILIFAKRTAHVTKRSVFFLVLIFTMIAILSDGIFGTVLGGLIIKAVGKWGLYIFAGVVILISLLLVINTPISQFLDAIKIRRAHKREQKVLMEHEALMEQKDQPLETPGDVKPDVIVKKPEPQVAAPEKSAESTYIPGKMSEGQMKIMDYMKNDDLFVKNDPSGGQISEEEIIHEEFHEKQTRPKPEIVPLNAAEINLTGTGGSKVFHLPPIDFLNKSGAIDKVLDGNLKAKAHKLEQTLQNFRVDARVIQVTQGPAITRYEIQPNVGVKVSSIVSLANDIALNLEARSIRIEAPIPGKAAVGIEVENDKINMVTLRDIVDSREFRDSKSKITFAIGKDVSGNAIIADLKEMPHMLIAGSTGSGKSVCINSIIISILYKATPDEVKFLLIDPKVVELRNYNGIPHLLIPVVTEPSKAAAALGWAVSEMTDRYKKFAEEGVRDLETFNQTVKKKKENDRVLPQVVIIIDELADLMMAAPSQVEESICRLAQMARAAGMHLIVATQRPSVDIITGVIKANIPSRISFAVSSQVDSRTILDMVGAEKLVGKGDMLFNPIGMPKPIRVQGTFISDSEVHKVIEYIKKQTGDIEYASDIIHTIEDKAGGNASSGDDGDELLADAIETVVKSGQASVSMLQRRFRIGYNRAARIVDMMEDRGIIGPPDGGRPRQVLLTEAELYAMQEETKDLK